MKINNYFLTNKGGKGGGSRIQNNRDRLLKTKRKKNLHILQGPLSTRERGQPLNYNRQERRS